jgi:hypothetical protein
MLSTITFLYALGVITNYLLFTLVNLVLVLVLVTFVNSLFINIIYNGKHGRIY